MLLELHSKGDRDDHGVSTDLIMKKLYLCMHFISGHQATSMVVHSNGLVRSLVDSVQVRCRDPETPVDNSSVHDLPVYELPSQDQCLYPQYYTIGVVLLLLANAILIQISHVIKIILMVIITTAYCAMNFIAVASVYDAHDDNLQRKKPR